jgi:hypothetical protein
VRDPKKVEALEKKFEGAKARIIVKMGLKKRPLVPARHSVARKLLACYDGLSKG